MSIKGIFAGGTGLCLKTKQVCAQFQKRYDYWIIVDHK